MHLRPFIGALCFISALPLPPLHAQTGHPFSTTPTTRAIAVYEWTGPLDHPTAARLIPVSLFINAHLQDAGVYLAQPIPFALQPGTLYLLQPAGAEAGVPDGRSLPAGVETIGALNIQSAHTTSSTTASAWAAYGNFLTPTEAAAATATSTNLSSRPEATGRSGETRSSPTQAPTDTTSPTPPAHTKKTKPARQQAYVTSPTTPILDDPDRPTLQSGPPASATTPPELTTLPPDLHQIVAISDAANRPPQTFATTWPNSTLRDQTLRALEALALPSVTHYIAFNHLTPADTPKPATTTTSATDLSSRPESAATGVPIGRSLPESGGVADAVERPSVAITTAPPTLTNAHVLAYTLTDTTTPTYILTAESPLTTNGPIYLTLIAQPTAAGPLHPTLLSITDAAHLDRTPLLRPIDAVDPDATGRADLLVELRSQTTRQFALYTFTTTPPQQILLTTPIQ
ncbi:MAG TPA: hypothetical protein VK814_08360 [Acidobacteriaceae bacterium]|nr:hypothetical protein [Acidobacteriaceae bacterium]